jgi:hypothetical protein
MNAPTPIDGVDVSKDAHRRTLHRKKQQVLFTPVSVHRDAH